MEKYDWFYHQKKLSPLYIHSETVHNLTAPMEVTPLLLDLLKPRSVLDVGCGTGNATRHLASYFDRAVGCDAGKEMIAQATEASGRSKNGSLIVYEVVDAEQLDQLQGLAAGSVDLLTAAMSVSVFYLSLR